EQTAPQITTTQPPFINRITTAAQLSFISRIITTTRPPFVTRSITNTAHNYHSAHDDDGDDNDDNENWPRRRRTSVNNFPSTSSFITDIRTTSNKFKYASNSIEVGNDYMLLLKSKLSCQKMIIFRQPDDELILRSISRAHRPPQRIVSAEIVCRSTAFLQGTFDWDMVQFSFRGFYKSSTLMTSTERTSRTTIRKLVEELDVNVKTASNHFG
ncbi:unnamed protein product, partial [Angiostrongylus costaricensis]|uniref:VASt domain-containing protein n=1 Tax=Angiostrongylus costaricensis TaxID=334426 RepID=A0A0R3PCL1_ANGCS